MTATAPHPSTRLPNRFLPSFHSVSHPSRDSRQAFGTPAGLLTHAPPRFVSISENRLSTWRALAWRRGLHVRVAIAEDVRGMRLARRKASC
ncbi:hypothetical protein [Haladaptatus litoreus]|uniref:hypothetical protein n=1 Tax=Haladaptatus litoreus TaxID=553468 RepID=UPI0011159F0E|nr:hypothetical protein [Haladaptatus litoreus]